MSVCGSLPPRTPRAQPLAKGFSLSVGGSKRYASWPPKAMLTRVSTKEMDVEHC